MKKLSVVKKLIPREVVSNNRLDIPGLDRRLLLRTHGQADSCISQQIQTRGIWEPYETSLLIEHLKAGDVFLDIGANIGYYTLLASVIVKGDGVVIACEPDLENCRLLHENLALNQVDNVVVFHAAVSDYNGSGRLYLSPDNKGDHRLYDCGDGRDSTPARVITGENLRDVMNRVDFIKIDTQGAEYNILKGLENIILENKSHLTMIVEFWPYGLRMSGASAGKMLDLLASFDMGVSIIDHYGRQLWPAGINGVRTWSEEVAADPSNQGFINLWITPSREI